MSTENQTIQICICQDRFHFVAQELQEDVKILKVENGYYTIELPNNYMTALKLFHAGIACGRANK